MTKPGTILRLYVFVLFSLSLLSVGETNMSNEKIWDQFVHHIHYEKDYTYMYESIVNRWQDSLHTVTGSEEKVQLLEQIGKKFSLILSHSNMVTGISNDDIARSMKSVTPEFTDRIGDVISRLKNLVPKSIKDQLSAVELAIKLDIVFSFVETGWMIKSLKETCDKIKNSEQYRKSSELQEEITKLKQSVEEAQESYQRATTSIDRIAKIDNTDERELSLEKIILGLEITTVRCEKAQAVLNRIINDIRQNIDKLSSAKADHGKGFIMSLFRLMYTIYDFMLKPASGLLELFRWFTATLQTSNVIGHTVGFYWTYSEIQELETHQITLSGSQNTIKQLMKDANFLRETVKKLQPHMNE